MLGHKIILKKFENIEIISNIKSDHTDMNLSGNLDHHKNLHRDVYRSFISNCQNLETTK